MRARYAIAIAITAACWMFMGGRPAFADRVFGAEPGERSTAHRTVQQCTQCHVSQHVLSDQKCLVCHAEIRQRLAATEGLHGPAARAGVFCFRCHREHRGAGQHSSGWAAVGGLARFDHARTGFPLRGRHAVSTERCASCHLRAPRHFDLLPTACASASCHQRDDAHAGSLGARCERCHVETAAFAKPRFDHNDPNEPERWALVGNHLKVACANCHPKPKGDKSPAFKSTPKLCEGCHDDVHRGRYKKHTCADCHTPLGWKDGGPL